MNSQTYCYLNIYLAELTEEGESLYIDSNRVSFPVGVEVTIYISNNENNK